MLVFHWKKMSTKGQIYIAHCEKKKYQSSLHLRLGQHDNNHIHFYFHARECKWECDWNDCDWPFHFWSSAIMFQAKPFVWFCKNDFETREWSIQIYVSFVMTSTSFESLLLQSDDADAWLKSRWKWNQTVPWSLWSLDAVLGEIELCEVQWFDSLGSSSSLTLCCHFRESNALVDPKLAGRFPSFWRNRRLALPLCTFQSWPHLCLIWNCELSFDLIQSDVIESEKVHSKSTEGSPIQNCKITAKSFASYVSFIRHNIKIKQCPAFVNIGSKVDLHLFWLVCSFLFTTKKLSKK